MKLEKQQVIDAAFDLLNEVGIEKFNLRALAAKLSVSATALYWHFSDKDQLISHMVSRIYAKAYHAIGTQLTWQEALQDFGMELKSTIMSYRDAARLCAIAKPESTDLEHNTRKISDPLKKFGLSVSQAISYEASIISFVLGWSVYKQNQQTSAHLERMMDFEKTFEMGLSAMINGFTAIEHKNSSGKT